jgi:Sulfotransferase domain
MWGIYSFTLHHLPLFVCPPTQPLTFSTTSTMDSLQRYPLSVILSFLYETEGTSLLITNKRYATQLLPVFRVKPTIFDSLVVVNSKKHRHVFVVIPVPDATVLLDRLNTIRLYRRRELPTAGLTTRQIAIQEYTNGRQFTTSPALQLQRFISKTDPLFSSSGTLLVSYPRSGNTLLRSLLERTTGLVTGSDTRPDRSLSRELADQHDLVGEGCIQWTQVACVKSHWPERRGHSTLSAKRVVLLVRNPWDAIDSYWNMNATKSHTRTLVDAVYDEYRDKWEGLVRNEITVWLDFLQYWMNADIPVLVVRYEDLVERPGREMESIMQFMLSQEALSTEWSERIKRVTEAPVERLGSYKPRSKGPCAGRSLHRYTCKQLEYIRKTCQSYSPNYLQLFGYDLIDSCDKEPYTESLPPLSDALRYRSGSLESMRINTSNDELVRPVDCPYGRLLQTWRHSVTDNDRQPLPTVAK